MLITKDFLKSHPEYIFVYEDNLLKQGFEGTSSLRNCSNTYGFITKRYVNFDIQSYYTVDEYKEIYDNEINKLKEMIKHNKLKKILISPLGSGEANRFKIWENVIYPNLKNDLKNFKNVEFLFN